MRSFVPTDSIPWIQHREVCGPHSAGFVRRAVLWRMAIEAVEDPRRSWCEFGVGEGESLDWFASRKPRENLLVGFDWFGGIPEPWGVYPAGQWKTSPYQPNRSDVRIVLGRFEETLVDAQRLADLTPLLGLVHVDCDLYSATRTVFECLGSRMGAGTVLLFDEFLHGADWYEHEARAFREFVVDRGIRFEYLARTDGQLALRILEVGTKPEWTIRPFDATGVDPLVTVSFGSTIAY